MLPFARGHSEQGTIDQEPWTFGPEVCSYSKLSFCSIFMYLSVFYRRYIPVRVLNRFLAHFLWDCLNIWNCNRCIVGGRSFQICFEQTIPDATTFLHSVLQVAHHGCACDDSRIFCRYALPWHVACRSRILVPSIFQGDVLYYFVIVNMFVCGT